MCWFGKVVCGIDDLITTGERDIDLSILCVGTTRIFKLEPFIRFPVSSETDISRIDTSVVDVIVFKRSEDFGK